MERLDLKYKTLFEKYKINTWLRKRHFIAQYYHENPWGKPESLYYKTVESLRKNFKTPFRGKSDAFVAGYLKNSEKCANYVYSNRMGNGSIASGDGYKYRGRGPGITGKDNYRALQIELGLPLLKNPDLLLDEVNSVLAFCWYWEENELNKYADKDNLDAISDIINMGKLTNTYGDSNGFDKRKKLYDQAKQLIK